MTCNTERLSEYLDDELAPDARRDVDLHLASCAECRTVLSELALVKDTAAELAGGEVIPDRDLWPGITANRSNQSNQSNQSKQTKQTKQTNRSN